MSRLAEDSRHLDGYDTVVRDIRGWYRPFCGPQSVRNIRNILTIFKATHIVLKQVIILVRPGDGTDLHGLCTDEGLFQIGVVIRGVKPRTTVVAT